MIAIGGTGLLLRGRSWWKAWRRRRQIRALTTHLEVYRALERK